MEKRPPGFLGNPDSEIPMENWLTAALLRNYIWRSCWKRCHASLNALIAKCCLRSVWRRNPGRAREELANQSSISRSAPGAVQLIPERKNVAKSRDFLVVFCFPSQRSHDRLRWSSNDGQARHQAQPRQTTHAVCGGLCAFGYGMALGISAGHR